MSTTETADRTGPPVLVYGRGWMMAPETAARAAELGLTSEGRMGFWVNGRAGVLGDVDAAVAAAAIGFMAPEAVRRYWEARPASLSAWDAALAWFEAAAGWGRRVLAPMPEDRVRRLTGLTMRVVEGADATIGPLFAASTAVPLPGDPAGDATVALNILRELRGCAHLAACHAAGLGPHATIISTDDPIRGGASWAENFGWRPPHPVAVPEARATVEAMTTAAAARAFEALDDGERAELVALVDEAAACADAHANAS